MSVECKRYLYKISDEFADFICKERGFEMSRIKGHVAVLEYIKNNNLLNNRKIKYDKKLYCLLQIKNSDSLSIFSLQNLLNIHFTRHYCFSKYIDVSTQTD